MALIEINRTALDYEFTATDNAGHSMLMDIAPEMGGNGNGFRPMQLMLAALGGCSAVDIVSILKKQKQDLQKLSIKIDGEREQGVEPALWKNLEIIFEISGNVEPQKARRAVELSMDKYCSVAETLRKAGATISWKVVLI